MKFKINLRDEDFIAFNIFYIFRSKGGKRSITIGRCSVLIVAILAIIAFAVARGASKVLLVEAIVLLVIAILWFFLYPKLIKRSVGKRLIKMRRDGNLPYETEVELDFSDTQVSEKTESTFRETPYSDFINIQETDEYIYLEKNTAESLIIPLRCVEDKDALLSFLREKI